MQPPLTGRCLFAAALRFHCREANCAPRHRPSGAVRVGVRAVGSGYGGRGRPSGERFRRRTYRESRARLPGLLCVRAWDFGRVSGWAP